MGYKPTMTDTDLWLRDAVDCSAYISVYLDYLCYVGANPEEFYHLLMDKYNFELKGVEDIDYHLGGNFYRDLWTLSVM